MMEQIFEKADLLGKTIKRTGYTNNIFVLFFTDETYAIFRGCGWDENDVELADESFNLEPTDYNAYELKELGVITQEKYNEMCDKAKAKQKIKQEKKEREEYEKLKLKYGNKY